jgi:hypothetical protein
MLELDGMEVSFGNNSSVSITLSDMQTQIEISDDHVVCGPIDIEMGFQDDVMKLTIEKGYSLEKDGDEYWLKKVPKEIKVEEV